MILQMHRHTLGLSDTLAFVHSTFVEEFTNVLFGSVYTKALSGDVKFSCSEPKFHEAKDGHNSAEELLGGFLQHGDIYDLTIIAEPIAEVDTFHVEFIHLS